MVYFGEEYPFHARWYRNGILESTITDVDYVVYQWDGVADDYISVDSGNITTRDTEGRWLAPFNIPDTTYAAYKCMFTPNGGGYPPIEDSLDVLEQVLALTGTESYSSTVCARDGSPIEGATVSAVAYGTSNVVAIAITDVNGDFTLENLPAGFAYTINANADGYIGKIADKVVM